MIKISIAFFLAFICNTVSAQNAEGLQHIDEVKKELINSKADTNRVLMIVDLCTAYQWSNIDSLNYYSKKGLKLSRKLKFTRGEVRILNSLGISSSFHGNIPQALDTLFKALQLAEKNKYRLETAICLNSIGACYFFLGDELKSVDFIRRAQSINESIKHAPHDLYWKIYIEFWLGTDYSDLNKLDSADIFLQKAYNDAFSPGFTDLYSIRPTILMFYGELFFKRGNFEKAFNYLHQAIATYDVYQDPFGTADASSIISGFFKEKNNPDSVIYYAKKGLDASLKFDYQTGILNNSKILAGQYDHTDTKQALQYLKIELAANDSLYGAQKIKELQKTLSEEQEHQQQIQEEQIEKQNRLKQNGFLAGLAVLLGIAFILFRNNRQRKKANVVLQQQNAKVESTLQDLKSTQKQLIQSEKMASLGELTAGIAHEIQNPLNFVNNFSDVNRELISELVDEVDKGNTEEVKVIANDIKDNEEKINHHGKRADAIVKGMLQHSRTSTGKKEPTDINKLANEYLRLSYYGLRAKDKSFNATMKTNFDNSIEKINIIPQDIGRVLLNLFNNAFYAVNQQKSKNLISYGPTVTVSTKKFENSVIITVSDNGNGIPQKVIDKIFQPFFTTKPTGEGTGLGLSLAYDIVKAHGGEIKVESKDGEGSEFIIQLPNNKA
ncbi:MAG TPA: ATP-binding protein [Hanamia sp.]|nr:ATP-binding protein [Hanamia sp.]